MQRIPALAADVVPDLREQITGGITLPSVVVQLHRLTDPGQRGIVNHNSSFANVIGSKPHLSPTVPLNAAQ